MFAIEQPADVDVAAFQWALVNEQNAIWKYSSCIFHDCLLIAERADVHHAALVIRTQPIRG
jgi:hypothetical protein